MADPVDSDEELGPDDFGGPERPALPPAPPPPPTGGGGDPPKPPPKSFDELGKPPTDPLEQQEWIHSLLVLTIYDAALDPDLSARDRRREIRTNAAAAATLAPTAKIAAAKRLIMADRAELEAKAKSKRGAKLEPRPPRPRLKLVPDGTR